MTLDTLLSLSSFFCQMRMHHVSSVHNVIDTLPRPLLWEWDTAQSPQLPTVLIDDGFWLDSSRISLCPREPSPPSSGSLSSGIMNPLTGHRWNAKVRPPCLNSGWFWRVVQVPYLTLGLAEAPVATLCLASVSLSARSCSSQSLASKPPAHSLLQCLFSVTLS